MQIRKAKEAELVAFPSFEMAFRDGVLRTIDIRPGENPFSVIADGINAEAVRVQVANEDAEFLHSIHIQP